MALAGSFINGHSRVEVTAKESRMLDMGLGDASCLYC